MYYKVVKMSDLNASDWVAAVIPGNGGSSRLDAGLGSIPNLDVTANLNRILTRPSAGPNLPPYRPPVGQETEATNRAMAAITKNPLLNFGMTIAFLVRVASSRDPMSQVKEYFKSGIQQDQDLDLKHANISMAKSVPPGREPVPTAGLGDYFAGPQGSGAVVPMNIKRETWDIAAADLQDKPADAMSHPIPSAGAQPEASASEEIPLPEDSVHTFVRG
jgi:hypothetical protein